MRGKSYPARAGRTSFRTAMLLAGLGVVAVAWASGWPPFAQRDFIEVARGGIAERLTNGADSVLANDIDIEDPVLTAHLVADVDHGQLELRSDGTFTYQHDGSKGDSDQFRYRAYDGTSFSRATRVTIEVKDVPNQPPYVIGEVPDQQAVVGVEYRLDLAGYFADPDENDSLLFRARGLPGSGSLRIDPFTGVLSGVPVDGDARNKPYSVEITAMDEHEGSARLTFDLAIQKDNRADLVLTIDLEVNPVSVGETARWNINIANQGPGDFNEGQLTATWTTSGPSLTLATADPCPITGNGSSSPQMTCTIGPLAAGSALTINVEGMQDDDGDNSLIGIISADDRSDENNVYLASAQVVARFSEGPTQTLPVSSAGVDAGDVNGDNEIDIVASTSQTIVYLNNGNRAVTTPGTSLGEGTGGSIVRLLDWNGDGSTDIAVGGLANSTVEIFVNDTSGGFSSMERLQNGTVGTVNDMIAADLNNDGRAELIVAGSSDTAVMLGRSQGGFDRVSLSSGAGLDLAVADIDQDGGQDIVVVRAADRAVDVHYTSGNDSGFNRTTLNYGSVATVSADDLNGDGAIDLLLGVDGDDLKAPENKVLYQQGNGGFSSGGSFGASPVTELITGDIDGDGWPDVVAVNEAGVHQLYLGSAGGGFALAEEQIVSDGMQRGVLTDFNDDQSLDLIMAGREAGVLEIHANNGIGRLGLGDRVAPELVMLGEATMSIPAGGEFVDPGATAVDDIDGDITDQIIVTGNVNPAVVGKYTMTYRVTDRARNQATRVRAVNVGVNEGTGGSGGGAMSLIFILALGMILVGESLRNPLVWWVTTRTEGVSSWGIPTKKQ